MYISPDNFTGTDSQRLQAAVDAAIEPALRSGRTVLLERTYELTAALNITNVEGLRLLGVGGQSGLLWKGAPSEAILRMANTRLCDISNFRLFGAAPFHAAIHSLTETPLLVPPGMNRYSRLKMFTGFGGTYQKGFRFGGTGTIDGNNDLHVIDQCEIISAATAGISIENSQVLQLQMNNNVVTLCPIAVTNTIGGANNGSFHWNGGITGGCTDAAFLLGGSGAGSAISNMTSELDHQFLRSHSTLANMAPLTLTNISCRTGTGTVIGTGEIVDYRGIGCLTVVGGIWSGDATTPIKMRVVNYTPYGLAQGFIMQGALWVRPLPTYLSELFPAFTPNFAVGNVIQDGVLMRPFPSL